MDSKIDLLSFKDRIKHLSYFLNVSTTHAFKVFVTILAAKFACDVLSIAATTRSVAVTLVVAFSPTHDHTSV